MDIPVGNSKERRLEQFCCNVGTLNPLILLMVRNPRSTSYGESPIFVEEGFVCRTGGDHRVFLYVWVVITRWANSTTMLFLQLHCNHVLGMFSCHGNVCHRCQHVLSTQRMREARTQCEPEFDGNQSQQFHLLYLHYLRRHSLEKGLACGSIKLLALCRAPTWTSCSTWIGSWRRR